MTEPERNRRIVLAERPHGRATLSSFRLEQVPIPALRDGELLLRTLGLLEGRNFGKLVVDVGGADT
jgi:NADPH-dependent curcumin reductase CurA